MPEDDFFKLLDANQAGSPGSADEIVFRDELGALKVLRNGEIADLDVPANSSSKPVSATNQGSPISVVSPEPAVISAPPPLAEMPEDPLRELENAINGAVKQAALGIADEQLQKRFRNVVQSRLKGIRNRVQVYETLVEKPEAGGIGLDEQTADRVGIILNNAYDSFHSHGQALSDAKEFVTLQTEAQKILGETAIEKPLRTFSPTTVAEQASQAPEEPVVIPPMPSPEPVLEKPERVVPPPRPVAPPEPPPSFEVAGKPKIEDVRYQAKLTGPVEEIYTMTLTDFRRLAPTPALATEKILEKIELLEAESFTRRVEGIRAWKENEISRMYVALGHQSMEERKSIADIIAERRRGNQPTLTEADVDAVIELNRKLRY